MANKHIKGPIINGAELRHKRKKELNIKRNHAFKSKGDVCPDCKKCNFIKGYDSSNQEIFFCSSCGFYKIWYPRTSKEYKSKDIDKTFERLMKQTWFRLTNSDGCCFDCSWRLIKLSWRQNAECINNDCENYEVNLNE